MLGRLVVTLEEGSENAGVYSVKFNAEGLESGIYFYRLTASGNSGSNFAKTRKMMFVK